MVTVHFHLLTERAAVSWHQASNTVFSCKVKKCNSDFTPGYHKLAQNRIITSIDHIVLNYSIPVRLCIVHSILSTHLFSITTYPTHRVVWRLELISGQRWATPRMSHQFITGLPYRDIQTVTPTGNLESLLYVTYMSQVEHAKCKEKGPSWNQTLNHRTVFDCIYQYQ